MNQNDTIFDGKAEKFQRNIYGSNKGHIRLSVLWDDMKHSIPSLSGEPLTILDAGGGLGQIAIKCSKLGHSIDLVEPSKDMLAIAEKEIESESLGGSIQIINESAQIYCESNEKQYDCIVFHAVLEWLAQPKETLQTLLTQLKPGGTLSLMFYNRNSAIMKTVLKGNFFRANGGFKFGQSNSLTPGNPLDQNDVLNWLDEWGVSVESKCGIRIFNDYLHAPVPVENLEKLIEVEKDFCRTEPFASLGRYIHLVCTKAL